MGSLYKRSGSRNWMMAVTIRGRQRSQSTGTSNRRLAEKMLARWTTQVHEGKFQLPRSDSPLLKEFASEFLASISHLNTKKRYGCSLVSLENRLGNLSLSSITADSIEDYKEARLASRVRAATVNRDLAVLRRILKIAQRKRFIGHSPFAEVELLEERKMRRKPHIVTFEEEERILQVAPPHIRVLTVLILETGLRSNREALVLKWTDVDFVNSAIRVRESKTAAGIRYVPLSTRCRNELLRWQALHGPRFSEFVFPNMVSPNRPLKDVRRSWSSTLAAA